LTDTHQCGFNGNTDLELCSRWMQLSALFPFYRNHNTLAALPQEAFRWSAVTTATKSAMAIRFALLPYMYTLFYNAHTRGDTVMRALSWEFPNDPSLADADRQFFLGPSILVTPVLDQGATSVNGVFPGLVEGTEAYYDWYTHMPVPVPESKNTTIQAPLGHLPVYIRRGAILACQQMRLTTRDARNSGWSILVTPDVKASDGVPSVGELYLDDGESLKPNATKMVNFRAKALQLNATVTGSYEGLNTQLGNVTFLGVMSQPASLKVTLNGMGVGQAVYNSTAKTVFVGGVNGMLAENAWAGNWTLSVG
jgi:alpha-glucosidase